MHNANDVRAAYERVTRQTAGMSGPLGFASADTQLLRDDQRRRLVWAARVVEENRRLVAALPSRPAPAEKSPAQRRIEEKLATIAVKMAGLNVSLALASLRRALDKPPHSN